jgi:hypothetical protein
VAWDCQYTIDGRDDRGHPTKKTYEVDCESRECPVSLTARHPRLVELIRLFRQSQALAKHHTPMYGADPPAWWVDTVTVLESCIAEEIEARP